MSSLRRSRLKVGLFEHSINSMRQTAARSREDSSGCTPSLKKSGPLGRTIVKCNDADNVADHESPLDHPDGHCPTSKKRNCRQMSSSFALLPLLLLSEFSP